MRTTGLVLAVMLVGAPSAPAQSPAARVKPPACFGAAAEPVLTDVLSDGLTLEGRHLYFTSASRIPQRMNVQTLRVEPLPHHVFGEVMDARQSFWITNTNELIAEDLATGKGTTLVGGPDLIDDLILGSSLGLDKTYIYYGHVEGPTREEKAAGFFRIRRDGSRVEERLAPSPDTFMPFVVAGGFVYWNDRYKDKWSVVRRALAPRAPMQLVARRSGPGFPPQLWVAENRVFFIDAGILWSAPTDGRAPAVEQIALGAGEIRALVVKPPCFYWVSGTTVSRAELDRGKRQTPLTLADERNFGGGTIATDGRYLYWGDPNTHRIVRAGPGSQAPTPAPELVAKLAPAQSRRPRWPGQLVLGEGWGCTGLHYIRGDLWDWQCWRGPGAGGRTAGNASTVAAKYVPKLVARSLAANRRRICQMTGSQPRCWSWDELMDGAPPASVEGEARYPNKQLMVGGTFSCTSDGTWVCSGDNSLGQLGNGTTAREAKGSGLPHQSGNGVLGDWHACSQAVNGDLSCWGRNDVGQLGYPTTETCRVGFRSIPCSTKPQPPVFTPKSFTWLQAGDLFTCVGTDRIRCWGASRDGFFGKAADCPPDLRRAWPTLNGTVAAPNAACAKAPTEIPGFETKDKELPLAFFAGSRGLCAAQNGKVRCLGAIPTPKLTGEVQRIQVQPGDQPAACAITGKGLGDELFCWGAGYSPASDLAAPVRITFEPITLPGAPVFDAAPPSTAGWPPVCDVHFACEFQPKPLPACAPDAAAVPWSELATRVSGQAGKTVHVRGPLVLGPIDRDASANYGEHRPCGSAGRAIVIGGTQVKLPIGNMYCHGDDSRLCCSAPAYGQPVIATGRLKERDGKWRLDDPRVCAESR